MCNGHIWLKNKVANIFVMQLFNVDYFLVKNNCLSSKKKEKKLVEQ